MRQEAVRTKKEEKQKYEGKIVHLNKKWRSEDMKNQDKIPTGLEDYKDAKVFTQAKYDKIEKEEIDISVVGDVRVSDKEKSILMRTS